MDIHALDFDANYLIRLKMRLALRMRRGAETPPKIQYQTSPKNKLHQLNIQQSDCIFLLRILIKPFFFE